jgi:AmiR/NasT family two-component response regulator
VRRTIVIAGYDATNDRIAARYLSRYYHVLVMPSVRGSAEDIRRVDPCVVVLHTDEYAGDSAEQLVELREALGPRVPIIATVAACSGEYLGAALETNVVACLVRPLAAAELDDALQRAVEWGEGARGPYGLIPAYGRRAREELVHAHGPDTVANRGVAP